MTSALGSIQQIFTKMDDICKKSKTDFRPAKKGGKNIEIIKTSVLE